MEASLNHLVTLQQLPMPKEKESMTNETIQTAEANDTSRESSSMGQEQGALSLKRIKVADSARSVDSRTGYGMLVSD